MPNYFSKRPNGKIWLNGSLVPADDALIHVLTHGLHYASSVFEGEKAYGGEVFELEWHTQRLIQSALELDFPMADYPQYSLGNLMAATREVIAENGLGGCYIRPIIWRGSEKLGVNTAGASVNVAIAVWDDWEKGPKIPWRLVNSSQYRRPPAACCPYKAKAAGLYTICSIEKGRAEMKEHKGKKFNDALMLDYDGDIAETTTANVFFGFGDELHTPIPHCFLDGITRQTVIRLAEENGVTVVERTIGAEEIFDADEMFVTGTLAEVQPIEFYLEEFPDGTTREKDFTNQHLTAKIVDLYQSEVRPG